MRTGRGIHLVFPEFLLQQIGDRAVVSGRTRAAELRYLLARGLELSEGGDIRIEIPTGEPRRVLISPQYEVFSQVADRAERYDRSMRAEALRMIAYAIQVGVDDQIRILKSLTNRSEHGFQRTAENVAPPCLPV